MNLSSRIDLEPLSAAHVTAGYALLQESRDQIARWLGWARTSTLPEYRAFVAGVVGRRRPHAVADAFAIIVDGAFAGCVETHDHNPPNRLASIGYWLGTPYTGRGIMTAAVMRVTDELFARRAVDRLEIYAAQGNVPSQRVAERAGFTREGLLASRLLIGDQRHDAFLFGRVRAR